MTFPIDLPEESNDETAATMVNFLYALGDALANPYRRRPAPLPAPPSTTAGNWPSSPELDNPF